MGRGVAHPLSSFVLVLGFEPHCLRLLLCADSSSHELSGTAGEEQASPPCLDRSEGGATGQAPWAHTPGRTGCRGWGRGELHRGEGGGLLGPSASPSRFSSSMVLNPRDPQGEVGG